MKKSLSTALACAFALLAGAMAAAGCGGSEEKVDIDTGRGAYDPDVPEGMEPSAMGLESAEERKSMQDAAQIVAEAMRTGEMPSEDVMQALPEAQQEAIRRAVESRQGQ
jgi:hypothetical protein